MDIIRFVFDTIFYGGFCMDKEFLECRALEGSAYTIINYFRLIELLKLSKNERNSKDVFYLIGGRDILIRLESTIKSGALDYMQTEYNLFLILENHIRQMKSVAWSNSVLIENAISDFNYICNAFTDSQHFERKETAKAILERELEDYRGDGSVDSILELLKGDMKGSPKEKVIGR